jgi:mannose/fructose/N-acetylgalactosamine-specific phosphotransferase system component IID
VLFQGFGVFIATWTVIISQFHASVALSATTVPMIVFFIVWVLFLFYCLFGCVPIMLYSGRCCVNSKNYETIFTVLSVVSKTALAWMVARGAARADIWQLAAGVERL